MSAWEGLADRIEKRIREIPAKNPGHIWAVSDHLIRKIAEEAARAAADEIERLEAERDQWKSKWQAMAAASLIAGTLTMQQPDTK